MARFACMLVTLALAPVAHAGPMGTSESGSSDGGSSESGSSDSGSSDSGASSDGGTAGSSSSDGSSSSSDDGSTTTGTDTTSTTGTETGADSSTSRGTTDAGCSECDESPGDITITSPADGASVDAPFGVNVTVTPTCSCDRCPCTERTPMYTQLFLDTVAVGAPCYELECAWEIMADVGSHTLYAAATFGPDDVLGTSVDVIVQSVAPGTETGLTTADDGPVTGDGTTGGSGSIGEDAPRGCGCAAPVRRSGGAWLVALVALLRRRR